MNNTRPPASRLEARSRGLMCAWAVCFGLVGGAATAGAGRLDDLLTQKDLTPEGLVRVFADFAFELKPQLQEPESFLLLKRGDCADFSNLASTVLTHHGYTTKLVVVMMTNQAHVVCYVKEAGGFLDFNHRGDLHPVIASNGSLEDIAGKVAGDFRSEWLMASVFFYRCGSPVYLDISFATESQPARPAAGRVAKHRAKVAGSNTPPAAIASPSKKGSVPN